MKFSTSPLDQGVSGIDGMCFIPFSSRNALKDAELYGGPLSVFTALAYPWVPKNDVKWCFTASKDSDFVK